VIARAMLATAALAAAAWLAVSIRDDKLQDSATAIAFAPHPSRAALALAVGKARRTRKLAPDSVPKLIEQQLVRELGDTRGADRLLQEIVRDEPRNARAWAELARNAQDRTLAARAQQRVRQLVAGL
jgi:hypothetical protein